MSLLFGGIFYMNKTYESKTREELLEFQTEWKKLSQKYQNQSSTGPHRFKCDVSCALSKSETGTTE